MYNQKNDPVINPASASNTLEQSSIKNSSSSSGEAKSSQSQSKSTSISSPSEELQTKPFDSNESSLYYVPKAVEATKQAPTFGTSSQLLSSTPFVNSQKQDDENSFNSLQLSGNLTNTPILNSNPESFVSPGQLTFQSSSSDEDRLRKLNQLVVGESHSEMDIFNPGKEISVSEPVNEMGKDQVTNSEDSPDVDKNMQFELSQDFSQFQFNAPEEEEPKKPALEAPIVEQPANSSENLQKGDSRSNKESSKKESAIMENNKMPMDLDNSESTTSKLIEEFLNKNGVKKEDLLLYLNKGKKPPADEKREKDEHIFEGKECFALWEEYFFPANVQNIDKETNNVTVVFEDGFTSEFRPEEIVFKDTFEQNQKVHVKMANYEYRNGHIVHNKRVGGEMEYWCVVEKEKSMIVDRFSIRFTKEFLIPRPSKIKPPVKMSAKTAIRKRRASNMANSSTTTSSEVTATDYETTKKKKKMTKPDPCHLFTNYYFLITKGNREDTNDNAVCEATTEAETEEEGTVEFNEHLAVQSIKNEGGYYIDKLILRELAKAKEKVLVCITDITRHYTNQYPVKFLYCVAFGIPVVHFDWLLNCIKQRTVLDFAAYVVPAGKDITREKIEQNFDPPREPYTPLNGIRIHVHVGEAMKYSAREISFLLQKIGCEVHTTHQITKKTRKMQFDINSVDFVLTLTNQVPALLVNTCKAHNKEILNMEWVRQCVINNKLLDVVDSPLFRYSVPAVEEEI